MAEVPKRSRRFVDLLYVVHKWTSMARGMLDHRWGQIVSSAVFQQHRAGDGTCVEEATALWPVMADLTKRALAEVG